MIERVPSTSPNNSPEVGRETANQQVENIKRKEEIHMYLGFNIKLLFFHIKLEILSDSISNY